MEQREIESMLKETTKKEFYDQIIRLETKVAILVQEKEENLVQLMYVLKELDTVGIIHGAGSKQRAKEALIKLLVENYGENYTFQYKKLVKKLNEKEVEKDGKQ